MKSKFYKIIAALLALSLSNCTSQKNVVIPYVLNIEAENSIYESIKNMNNDNISFYLEHLKDNNIKVHLSNVDVRFQHSNRKLFINDKFYPLVFDTDYKFYGEVKDNYPVIIKFEDEYERKSVSIKIPKLEERLKNKSLYLEKVVIYNIDWSTFWVIDNNGKLLETNSQN